MLTQKAVAQEKPTIQIEPGVSYNYNFQNNWSFNGKSTMRFTLDQPTDEGQERGSEFNFNETLLFATYEFWNNIELSGGYGFRIDSFDETWFSEHRIMQQLGFILYAQAGKRVANRIRLEQRIQDADYTNRWRYRIGFDSPLNGRRLDANEMYIILSNELLWSFTSIEHDFENRLYAGLGWYFNSQYKVESGVQYRAANLGSELENAIWITNIFYINKRQPQKKGEE
nr:DUF2490 domain-containing protein [Tunicatimonas sp. TK19036]